MTKTVEVRVPDIGDFKDIDVIEVLVTEGSDVNEEDSLIAVESEKATMEIPSPRAGRVRQILVKVGDKVSEGSPILSMDVSDPGEGAASGSPSAGSGDTQPAGDSQASPPDAQQAKPRPAPSSGSDEPADLHAEVLVIGAGPGGYTAAFRAADLGKQTVLVERYPTLGGVCLNVGCIPSKALLHVARVVSDAAYLGEHGVAFGAPEVDPAKLRGWVEAVVGKLTGGLKSIAARRKVQVVEGTASFTGPNRVRVQNDDDQLTIAFEQAIIAAGSQAARIPGLPDDPRIMDSTGALALESIPRRLLVIGGGIIGLEMATVYHALGTKVTVVEMLDALISECDPEIVRPLEKRIRRRYDAVYLSTRVTSVEAQQDALQVRFEGKSAPATGSFDAILVAAGRRPNGHALGAENAGVKVDEHGFIPVDDQQRTNVENIFAIGDIAGPPMLAHKASHEGKVAAEVAAGLKSGFEDRVIPAVAYTDPELAWVGLSEAEARRRSIDVGKGSFPWAASGRSLALGRDDGLTKLIFDKDTQRIIGMAAVGPSAGDLIAEGTLAIEMGCDARDIALTIHPHPTLSETVAMAAEAFEGTITDLYLPKKR